MSVAEMQHFQRGNSIQVVNLVYQMLSTYQLVEKITFVLISISLILCE